MRRFPPLIAVGCITFLFGAAVSAGAAKLITGKDIKNGSIGIVDLSKNARTALQGASGTAGASGAQGAAGARGETGATGARGDTGAKATPGLKARVGRQAPRARTAIRERRASPDR